ncbi:MAG: DUF302 domain-containing protein [Candidatus Cloacimonetes bacterium]|jgi:uncharacterized protein (DUF302 family)|nr:DUF302 domain-containing protein [Candidatus Cloacimonadota bacterium]
MKYSIRKKMNTSFDEARERVIDALQKEGFGILTEIDVKATLKKKINVDFDNYIILGACNPSNAFKALNAEIEIGLMLPCNVIVYQQNNEIYVSAILPSAAMGIIENELLKKIAANIEQKLSKVIKNL